MLLNNGTWFEKSYRRSLMDMHIEDWDDIFLSEYCPVRHVELLKIANVQTAMIYANSHVGCCYWPTKTGYIHKAFRGKDILGDMVNLCHEADMDVVLYYSLIFNNHAYDDNPEMRIIDMDGYASCEKNQINSLASSRYGVCCPNSSEYRDFVEKQIVELCEEYEFEGMFFDMTFWPDICFCENCKRRFFEETGNQIPETINWNDKRWLEFHKKREQWLSDFAGFATNTVKRVKPEISVEHNSATLNRPWQYATSHELIKHNDYIGGDLYGGWLQQSFICKLYYSLTLKKPFEYMTSVCNPHLSNHTTIKSKDMLSIHTYLALAHGGAFLFIDAIDPIGTQNPEVYQIMGDIFKESKMYEHFLQGELHQDAAVYFSFKSKYDRDAVPAEAKIEKLFNRGSYPHMDAALGAVDTLRENHIPFGVISQKNLGNLKHKVLVIPGVLELDKEEEELIKDYVYCGGNVYISGNPSDELLKELAGVEFEGYTEENVTYIRPVGKGIELMPGIKPDYPVTVFNKQVKARCSKTDNVMAVTVLPYTDPEDRSIFASIHSNPPGIITDYPAVVYGSYGKGKVLWISCSLEDSQLEPYKKVFANMINELAGEDFLIKTDAPSCVEIITLYQEENKRYVISLVNEQEKLPPIVINNIRIMVKLKGKKIKNVVFLPSNEEVSFRVKNGFVEFEVSGLEIFKMFELNYE